MSAAEIIMRVPDINGDNVVIILRNVTAVKTVRGRTVGGRSVIRFIDGHEIVIKTTVDEFWDRIP